MAEQEQGGKPSAMQLSTFTRVTWIPRDRSYADLPVAVRVKAPEMTTTLHEHAPVDVVAVLDVSGSMAYSYSHGEAVPTHGFERAEEAMGKAMQYLGRRDGQNRLAVVAFADEVRKVTPLVKMDKEGQQWVKNEIDELKRPGGNADYETPLKTAAKILDDRKAAEKKDRLAFIFFLSDGKDVYFEKTDEVKAKLNEMQLRYPIHAFDVSETPSGEALQTMADVTSGSYSAISFYLYVPEGQQGDGGEMDLLAVGGSYRQSWDQKLVALGDSVVAVARPPPASSCCQELGWIEERVEYWRKVKLDLSAMYDKMMEAEAEVECKVTEALRQASMAGFWISFWEKFRPGAKRPNFANFGRNFGNFVQTGAAKFRQNSIENSEIF